MALNNVLKKSTVKLLEYTESTVKIVVHVIFWTAFVGRCSKSNLKPDGTILVVMERLMTCAKGFAIMIATSLRKSGGRLSGPAAFLHLSFFSLTNTSETVTGISLKASLAFVLALKWFLFLWSRPNEVLKPD